MASVTMWRGATTPMERLFAADGGSVAGLDDAALWERFAARHDETAFEALVVRHGPMVLRAARAIVGDHHAAEDLVQTTFATLARRGNSIRQFETLAPWLHRVATRAAIRHRHQNRRQLGSERRAEAWPADSRGQDRAEIVAAIHAELDRLPASYRVPIVLCDLEGWTKASAAAHLGWTEGAVRGRLERGRARLRVQLTRHGFGPALGSLASLFSVSGEASAASLTLRPGLVAASVRAGIAAAGSSLGPVAWISQVSADLVAAISGVGSVRAGLVALGVAGSVGVAAMGWTGSGRAPEIPVAGLAHDAPSPVALPRPTPAPSPVPIKDDQGKPGDLVSISGRVVEPTGGQPVPGASVRVRPYVEMRPQPTEIATNTDNAGRFTVRVPRHLVGGSSRDAVKVVATAAGFGPGWQGLGETLHPDLDHLTIPLTVDDVPLVGRIVDRAGQPVADALVRVNELFASTTPDLTAWIDRVRRIGIKGAWEGVNWRQLVELGSFPDLTARTDPAGRFRLVGLGRDRVAELVISRPGLATVQVNAITREGGPVVGRPQGEDSIATVFEPNWFEATLPLGRTVEGVIRDAESGQPVAGMPLEGMVVDDQSWNVPLPGIRGASDEAGRYQLAGLPEADQYRVLVRPIEGQPYPHCDLPTPTTKDLAPGAPVAFDLTLRRGVVIRGRVTNGVTGRPIINAAVQTYVLKGNPEATRYPGVDRSGLSWDRTDADGKYAVVALPGRGLLTVISIGAQQVSRDYAGMDGFNPKTNKFDTLSHMGNLRFCNVVRPIQPEAGSSPTIDLVVDPGGSVTGKLVDPAGQPLLGTTAIGLHPVSSWLSERNPTDRFAVQGLRADESRRVYFFQDDRKLVGSVLVHTGQTDSPVVKLEPAASVTGRLLNADGKPQANLSLVQLLQDQETPNRGVIPEVELVDVDEEGRFRIDRLIPGLAYKVYPVQEQLRAAILDDLVLQPGETKDLGDLVLKPFPTP